VGEVLRFAVIGAGRIGALHAAHLAGSVRGAELSAVVDTNLDAARRTAVRDAYATADLGQVLADERVDALLIASPTPLHASQIAAAARAGKAIFSEKPVALDVAETRAAMDTVEAAGVPFQIGFQRRYDPGFVRARALIESGAVGRIEMFRALACDPEPASLEYLRTSGGIYKDMAIHDFDVARFLCGEVAEVSALGASLVDPRIGDLGDADTSVLTLRFQSGALGVIQNSRRAIYGYDIRTEVQGERGKVVVENERATPVWTYSKDGVAGDYYHWFIDRFREAYRLELQAFVETVRAGAKPTPGPVDALESLRVAEAATRSFRSGRPVRLTEIP
jgi:myo-inositol 2-dehydrogenase/D-chiro-inositol 1-dehydrogenase